MTSPELEPAREARFLAERLAAAGMPLGELIVNRVHERRPRRAAPMEDVAQMLAPELGAELAGRVASNLADFDVLVRRDRGHDRGPVAQLGGARADRWCRS